jgi:hypothetical protein
MTLEKHKLVLECPGEVLGEWEFWSEDVNGLVRILNFMIFPHRLHLTVTEEDGKIRRVASCDNV